LSPFPAPALFLQLGLICLHLGEQRSCSPSPAPDGCGFPRWQTLIGGLLLHISWKLGWVEINSNSRAKVLSWLPSSMLFVGIIYAGSRALSKLSIPVFFTLHNASEVIVCLYQKFISKELTSPAKIWSAAFLLVAAGCLPFYDSEVSADQ
uniref:Transmembrane protein 241 n=1 Tax=Vombatus ursinus TaxID=29139 RepID=A0A4X2KKR5_VOMUR